MAGNKMNVKRPLLRYHGGNEMVKKLKPGFQYCPECNGTGFGPGYRPFILKDPSKTPESVPLCSLCHGRKTIPDETYAKWMHENHLEMTR